MEKEPTVPSHDDGAGDKLVDENGQTSKSVEVKYVTPFSQNGDAVIDIENMKTAFAGMGKEELMKFANDPFWVRTRWFLFILFWLLWVAMLAGAIAIIVLAPKCSPPAPKEWWEKSPIYKVDVGNFGKTTDQALGDLKGFTSRLSYLQTLGVKTIVLSNILKVSDVKSDGIDEFKTISSSYGNSNDLKHLISAAKDKGLKLLLTLIPNHSSLKNNLFIKSVERDPKYSSFYVWAQSKGSTSEGLPIPPNNWLSKDNTSAWEWNNQRKEFFLHQFSNEEPEFNFHNADVIKYFIEVMRYWLDLGINGFYLERTPYLIEDKDLQNETKKRDIGSATHTDYDFYNHAQTYNHPDLALLLKNWTKAIANNSGIIIVDDVANIDRSGVKVAVQSQTIEPYPIYSSNDLVNLINNTLAVNSWPSWQISVKGEEEGSDLSRGMLLFTMLLPGIPVTLSGQELGLNNLTIIPWDNNTEIHSKTVDEEIENEHSFYNAYKKLVESRDSPSVLYGSLEQYIMNGTSALAYTRIKSGNPGYLVVFNIGSEDTVVNASELSSIPEELSLMVTSDKSSMADKNKVDSTTIILAPRSVAVFSFVPKAKE